MIGADFVKILFHILAFVAISDKDKKNRRQNADDFSLDDVVASFLDKGDNPQQHDGAHCSAYELP